MTRLRSAATVAAGCLAVAAAVMPTPASAATHGTAVRRVSPVDAAGALRSAYRIGHRYGDATCQAGAETTGTAYRCFTPQSRRAVYDPCWLTDDPAVVVCLTAPWRHRVVRLAVTRGFDPDSSFHPASRPWGVRLAGGRRCLVALGAVTSAHGHAVRYACRHHVVLAGPFLRAHAFWRVRAYRDTTPHAGTPHYRSLGRLRVMVAWRGRRSLTPG